MSRLTPSEKAAARVAIAENMSREAAGDDWAAVIGWALHGYFVGTDSQRDQDALLLTLLEKVCEVRIELRNEKERRSEEPQ